MKLVCCCLSQVFFIKNLFHLITTMRCSNIDQDSQPNTHTHPPGKRKIEKEGKEEEGEREPASHHTPHHNTSTHNPNSYHAPHLHHTQRERGKGKRGSLCVWCGCDVWY